MNEMSHKPAHTVTELASARQHQRPGRPSWSARWRVDKQPTQNSVLLCRRQRGRLWVDCTEREGRGRMFHRTPLVLQARHPAEHRKGGEGEEDGDWGRREGGEGGVVHKQQWMVHPLCWCQTSLALLPIQLRRAAHDATAARGCGPATIRRRAPRPCASQKMMKQ